MFFAIQREELHPVSLSESLWLPSRALQYFQITRPKLNPKSGTEESLQRAGGCPRARQPTIDSESIHREQYGFQKYNRDNGSHNGGPLSAPEWK